MSQSYDLFCRWKHVKKIQSDNAGAIALGVTRATVSSWKQGKNAEIQYIEQMALDIGDSPETWSALVMAERSNSEAEKAAWKRIAQKLASVAMALALGVGFASPRDVQAAMRAGSEPTVYTLCEMVDLSQTPYFRWLGPASTVDRIRMCWPDPDPPGARPPILRPPGRSDQGDCDRDGDS